MVLVEFSTTQLQAFRTAFDAINSMISETTLEFSPTGITIRDLDKTGKILVSSHLEADKFDSYKYDSPYDTHRIGVNIDSIVKGIKSQLPYDVIEFKLIDNKGCKPSAYFTLKNKDRKDEKVCHLKLCSILTNPNAIKNLDYSYEITMNPSILGKYIKDLNHSCSKVSFLISPHQLTIQGFGDDDMLMVFTINSSKNLSIITDTSEMMNKDVDIKYLMLLNKCNTITQEVSMYFSSQNPVTVKYPLSSIGVIYMVLI